MKCPVCNVELKMADRQGVEIDYCPQCRGVWLDRGELDKIIGRSNAVAFDEKKDYDDDDRHEGRKYDDDRYYHKGRRRKSFLGEIFDFD